MKITVINSLGQPLAVYDGVVNPDFEFEHYYSKEQPGAAGWIPWAPPLIEIRQQKQEQLKALATQRLATIVSSALGTAYSYPYKRGDDQNNLLLSALDIFAGAAAVSIPCRDSAGTWARRDHNAAQVKAVIRDVQQAVLIATSRVNSAVALVETLTDAASIEAVTL